MGYTGKKQKSLPLFPSFLTHKNAIMKHW